MGSLRRKLISSPLRKWVAKALPDLSPTEAEALEAGTTWWEADLFAGNPDWNRLGSLPPASLSAREQAFLDGPVEALCAGLDNWSIEFEHRELTEEIWNTLRKQGFFGMIIPEQYGGLGFSAAAHSAVVKKIASRNLTAAITVMVPNSLGPGELLLQYGTEEQKRHYLPRLASGEEVPCFGLTSLAAGSDASAMTDEGVVIQREGADGSRSLAVSLSFDKRYITLAPVATLVGLAVKLRDPDHLLGSADDLGITVVLVPTDTPGVSVGRRHLPSLQAFQNGPVRGRDVIVPISQILGGKDFIGRGWAMLMGALAAGRGISLPALGTGAAQYAARSAGAYARIRHQFGTHIGSFEGVREKLAPIGGAAYVLESARRLTTVGLDAGEKPAIVSAIMKYHATERMRSAVDAALDVQGGKTVIDGPRNDLQSTYRAVPVAITVEGANIVTRSLIIFGQGAIRCHPYLLREMRAAQSDDDEGLQEFDEALFGHLRWQLVTLWRSWWRGLTDGRGAPTPADAGDLARHYQRLGRYSAALALASEIAMITLGGSLKRRESLTARLGDILSELYLLSATLKRFEEDGRPAEDRAFLEWSLADGLHTIEHRLEAVTRNFPNRFWGWLMRWLTLPLGRRRHPPSDELLNAVAEAVQQPGEARERLTTGLYTGRGCPLATYDAALEAVVAAAAAEAALAKAKTWDLDAAVDAGVISAEQAQQVATARELAREVAEVDDFPADYVTRSNLDSAGSHRQWRSGTPKPHITASTRAPDAVTGSEARIES